MKQIYKQFQSKQQYNDDRIGFNLTINYQNIKMKNC